jgi:hypothetical protein
MGRFLFGVKAEYIFRLIFILNNCIKEVEEIQVLESEKHSRFKGSLMLEYVLSDLFGKKEFEGTASGFKDPDFCKKSLLRAINRIRSRLSEIPLDERLIQSTGIILDNLESKVNEISESANTDWDIITGLLHLVVHLIGFDMFDGKAHRSVFFFQNLGQEQEYWKWQVGAHEYYDNYRKEEKHRIMLVNQLHNNKIPKYQIATLLGLSTKRVNQIIAERGIRLF